MMVCFAAVESFTFQFLKAGNGSSRKHQLLIGDCTQQTGRINELGLSINITTRSNESSVCLSRSSSSGEEESGSD